MSTLPDRRLLDSHPDRQSTVECASGCFEGDVRELSPQLDVVADEDVALPQPDAAVSRGDPGGDRTP